MNTKYEFWVTYDSNLIGKQVCLRYPSIEAAISSLRYAGMGSDAIVRVERFLSPKGREMNTTAPSQASDSGPDTKTCHECGTVYVISHNCSSDWDRREWLHLAEENTLAASRITDDNLAIQKRMRLDAIEHAAIALLNAKELLCR